LPDQYLITLATQILLAKSSFLRDQQVKDQTASWNVKQIIIRQRILKILLHYV